jgi:hypothetical protein
VAHYQNNTTASFSHIRHLSQTIGGRGSCTTSEKRAAEYVAQQLRELDISDVRVESFTAAPSTYRPYALAFGLAFMSSLLAFVLPWRGMIFIATLVNAAAAWGMLAETDFAPNWMRWLLPTGHSQNTVAVIPAADQASKRVVLCAHLDSHRTPIFYSSQTWQTWFTRLVTLAFASLVFGTLFFGMGSVLSLSWLRWFALPAALVQGLAAVLSLFADFTPFSPGANDNASGVQVTLDLVERLRDQPLNNTEVWLAFTGCEEAGAYGISNFLDSYAKTLGDQTLYVILDQVGLGQLTYLTVDGLIVRRKTHPAALSLARSAARKNNPVGVAEAEGMAYTDAAVATKRGLTALTLVSIPGHAEETSHWHQLSDTITNVDRQAIADAHSFTWQILQILDRGETYSKIA